MTKACFVGASLACAAAVACTDTVVPSGPYYDRRSSSPTPTTVLTATPLRPLSPPEPSCPIAPPTVGLECIEPAACDYGTSADPNCNLIARCINGAWFHFPPSSACLDVCPADMSAVSREGTCPTMGVACAYDEGTCGCVAPARADAGIAPDADADAGADSADADADASDHADAGRAGVWQCAAPVANCPARRPLVGTRCAREVVCDYGSCALGRNLTFGCIAGLWHSVNVVTCDL